MAVAALAFATWNATAHAGNFPNRPITLIMPWGAGTDAKTRALATAAEDYLGQSVVVENRPDAGGTLAPEQMAATAKPDGYTISQLGPPSAPFIRKATYDPTKDFTYIIGITGLTTGVAVKSKRFQAELVQALLGGYIAAMTDAGGWAPQVDSGQFRLLVTGGAERSKNWPDVPTMRETGFDIVANAPNSIGGPKGMDPRVVKILHELLRKPSMAPPSSRWQRNSRKRFITSAAKTTATTQ